MRSPAPPAGPPPDEASLRDAALRHLARYSTTRAGLLRVLDRRVDRWAQTAAAPAEAVAEARRAVRAAVARLAAAGAVDDAAFAAGRIRALHRAGRSSRAISAHLQAKGVPTALVDVPDDPATELAAALLYAGRRRLGPFRSPPDPDQRQRDLARLARAGFAAATAMRLLHLPPAEAEALLLEARRG
jgi:regulatory protein